MSKLVQKKCGECGKYFWHTDDKAELCNQCRYGAEDLKDATRSIRVQLAIERNIAGLIEITNEIHNVQEHLNNLLAASQEYQDNIVSAALDLKAEHPLE